MHCSRQFSHMQQPQCLLCFTSVHATVCVLAPYCATQPARSYPEISFIKKGLTCFRKIILTVHTVHINTIRSTGVTHHVLASLVYHAHTANWSVTKPTVWNSVQLGSNTVPGVQISNHILCSTALHRHYTILYTTQYCNWPYAHQAFQA